MKAIPVLLALVTSVSCFAQGAVGSWCAVPASRAEIEKQVAFQVSQRPTRPALETRSRSALPTEVVRARMDGGVSILGAVERDWWASKYRFFPSRTIPYKFSSEVSEDDKELFRKATKMWSSLVKLTFNEVTSNPKRLYIEVSTSDAKGCHMTDGEAEPGNMRHVIQIARCKSMTHTIVRVAHEIGHSLGLEHEQLRPDRSTYLTINKDAIRDSDSRSQYAADFWENMLNPLLHRRIGEYNLLSVMQYSPLQGAEDKERPAFDLTDVGKERLKKQTGLEAPKVSEYVGQRECITVLDVASVEEIFSGKPDDIAPSPGMR
jgi:Astacin (Peptidase family M12A)